MMYLGDKSVGIATAKYMEFNPFKYLQCCYHLFYGVELPETIVIDFEGSYPSDGYGFHETFRNCTGVKNIIIKNLIIPDTGLAFNYSFSETSAETIIFENSIIYPTKFARTFSSSSIKHIYGQINMSNAYGNNTNSNSDAFYYARNLEDVEFVPNSLKRQLITSGIGNGTALHDNSLISLGNAMDANFPNNQPLNSSSYLNRTKTIMGKNEENLFVADQNGSLSLYDFITTVKGWTLT